MGPAFLLQRPPPACSGSGQRNAVCMSVEQKGSAGDLLERSPSLSSGLRLPPSAPTVLLQPTAPPIADNSNTHHRGAQRPHAPTRRGTSSPCVAVKLDKDGIVVLIAKKGVEGRVCRAVSRSYLFRRIYIISLSLPSKHPRLRRLRNRQRSLSPTLEICRLSGEVNG